MPATDRMPPITLVKVDKSDRMPWLLSGNQTVARFRIALGGDPHGHKQRECDQRTPEGRDLLDSRKRGSACFRAIHVAYPDAADRRRARRQGVDPGGATVIHGHGNGLRWLSAIRQRYDWTDGCIGMSHADMQRVRDPVRVPTPIEISP